MEILKRIVLNRQLLASTVHFALDSAFPYPESAFGQSIYIGINIPRSKLQLAPDQKPGDIDCLIVPFCENEILFEKTIAIEAKIVRPTVNHPSRNANTMGRTQVEGLLRDGFPFVGLVHVSVPEPLPLQLHWSIPILSDKSNGPPRQTGEVFSFDPFPLQSAKRQEGRLASLGLAPEVGYNVTAITLSKSEEGFGGNTFGEDRTCTRNPATSEALIKSVQSLLEAEPGLFDVVYWFDKE